MIAMTLLGDKNLLLPVAFILFLWLFWKKQRWAAWHWLGLTIFTAGSVEIAKRLIYTPPPHCRLQRCNFFLRQWSLHIKHSIIRFSCSTYRKKFTC